MPRTTISPADRKKGAAFVSENLNPESDDIKLLFWLLCYAGTSRTTATKQVPELNALKDTKLKRFDFAVIDDRYLHRSNLNNFIVQKSRFDKRQFDNELTKRGLRLMPVS